MADVNNAVSEVVPSDDQRMQWLKSTTDDLHALVNELVKKFRTSEFGNTLRSQLAALIKFKQIDIDQCICIGLGPFTGDYDGPLHRKDGEFLLEVQMPDGVTDRLAFKSRSLCQLAGLEVLLEELNSHHKIRGAYMKDPAFRTLDKMFLHQRGFIILEEGDRACDFVSERTFLFSPFVVIEGFVSTLQAHYPGLYYGSNIKSWMVLLSQQESESDQHRDLPLIAVLKEFAKDRESLFIPDDVKFPAFIGGLGFYYKGDATIAEELRKLPIRSSGKLIELQTTSSVDAVTEGLSSLSSASTTGLQRLSTITTTADAASYAEHQDDMIRWMTTLVNDLKPKFANDEHGRILISQLTACAQSKLIEVTECICLGLGSFRDFRSILEIGEKGPKLEPHSETLNVSGGVPFDFSLSACGQIAMIEVLLEKLSPLHGKLDAHFYDPKFDELDKKFLFSRGHHILSDVASVCKMGSPSTFLVAISVPCFVLAPTLHKCSPSVYLGHLLVDYMKQIETIQTKKFRDRLYENLEAFCEDKDYQAVSQDCKFPGLNTLSLYWKVV